MLTEGITTYSITNFADEVRTGLSKPQKELPSKYLYDEVGSALFEVISVLPEYGLTRADERLLRRHSSDIIDRLQQPTIVAELGSGCGKKTRWILEALSQRQRTAYYPIEISPSALARCRQELGYLESVSIVGFEREYLDGLIAVAARRHPGEHLLVLFLGSTIGNFDGNAGEDFLREIRRSLIPGDALLVGTDLKKPIPQLIQAYDDPTGVTAAFNLNLLARVNRELGGNFVLTQFHHTIVYNQAEKRIEMHLRSTVDQTVEIARANLTVRINKDETIWTESCRKFSTEEMVETARRTGFHCDTQWVDQEWPFAQNLFIVP